MDDKRHAEELLRRAEQDLDTRRHSSGNRGGALDFVYSKWSAANTEQRVLYGFGLAFAFVFLVFIPCVLVWPYITNPATHYSYRNGQLEIHFAHDASRAITSQATITPVEAMGQLLYVQHDIVDDSGNKILLRVSPDGSPILVKWNGKELTAGAGGE